MNFPANRSIRVLLVDDSPLIRTVLNTMLDGLPDIQVVGQARDGQEAVRMVVRLQPDVITMDIRMPQMDGLEATRHILSVCPTPIVVVASSVYAADYNIAFNALEAGALTVIEKPHGLSTQEYDKVREELLMAVRAMAGVTVIPRRAASTALNGVGPMTAMLHAFFDRPIQLVAMTASTGGPAALKQIIGSLPANFAIPIAIVQHMLPAFVPGLAEWLSEKGKLPVRVAQDGDWLLPGRALLAPGGRHMTVSMSGVVRLDDSEPVQGQRPSGTRLFQSAAKAFRSNAVGIILTGMGEDGVDGLVELSQTGAHVIAQDEMTSTVFGMPKEAIERGIVDEVLTPEGIISRLTKLHHHVRSLASKAR